MISVKIFVEDLAALEEDRSTHPHPRVQQKLHALYFVGPGYSRHDGARMIGVSEGTVQNSIHTYERGAVDSLRHFNPHPQTAVLDRHTTTLREIFTAQSPHTVQEAVDRIESPTGVHRIEWSPVPRLPP